MRSLMSRVRDLTSASDVPVLRLDPATCDEPPPVFHALINIVVLGSGYAGKSCLVTRMCRSRWVQFSTAGAAGFDFLRLRVGGAKVGCVVADPLDGNRTEVTAIERAQAAHGAVLVYDATKRRTLAGVHRWLALLDEHASPLPPCILVATFADKVTAVAELTPGLELAKEYGLPFFAVSALTGVGCDEAFTAIVRAVAALRLRDVAAELVVVGAVDAAATGSDAGGGAVATASSCVIA